MRKSEELTSSDSPVPVEVILELDADLSVRRLLAEECMLQQLIGVGSMSIVFDQTHTDEVHKLLRPRTFTNTLSTIWNDLTVDIRSTDITREQFKCSLKIWLSECAYGRRRI